MLMELKARAAVALGAGMLVILGRDRFYRVAQERRGIAGKIAAAFCEGHAGRVGANYATFRAERGKDRITDIALRYYSDDSLAGYGDETFSKTDGKPLLEQQRGLIIPLVERAIVNDRPRTVLEIGTGNGDVLAYLSEKYPDIEFVGVDLSVVNAERKHGSKNTNMRFVKGYALDLFRAGELRGDLVFGSSTFCAFAPRELEAYLNAIPDTRRIIISDPVTFGNKHTPESAPRSRHMDSYMWWHNYFGYLTAAGFNIDHFETVRFSYSWNPDAQVVLISGSKS